MSTAVRTYRVTVTRGDGLWAAEIDGLPPGVVGVTDVEHHRDLEAAVRDLVAGLTDTEPQAFELAWSYAQGDVDYTEVAMSVREWEAAAERAVAERDAHRRAAIESMRRAGLSQRDAADLIGISHQRVSQLAAGR